MCDGYHLVSDARYWHVSMTSQTLHFGLVGLLALGLLFACYTDWKSRIIENWLNLAIALAAPIYWWVNGLSVWPDMAIQAGLGLGVFAFFTGMFAIGAMGGGNVKLLGALALWFPPLVFLNILIVMAILGGVLTIIVMVSHKMKKAEGKPEIPYGIAISLATLWSIYERYLNHFA
jgi:prepilin peptidase CpaA